MAKKSEREKLQAPQKAGESSRQTIEMISESNFPRGNTQAASDPTSDNSPDSKDHLRRLIRGELKYSEQQKE